MTAIGDFINNYISWLKDNTTGEMINDNTYEITSPFLDRHNDYIQIYISEVENGYILTDDGFIMSDLELSGMSINTAKRTRELNLLLNRFGINLDKNNALTVTCQKSTFPQKKHALIQAMLATNDLFVMSQTHVESFFAEDVKLFLNESNLRFSPDISIVGKSSYVHNYDYLFSASDTKPERFMRLANNLERGIVGNLIFSWSDTSPRRPDGSKLITLVNDLDKKPKDEDLSALKEYSINPLLWSDKERLLEEVA
ncbi:MAG: DUF1828 domain-containing protein [Coriobacteriia bacterium]|nr:DUF1828 domain-containing protein [Coriobacteriia bacterium]